jgi:hypothetical protein
MFHYDRCVRSGFGPPGLAAERCKYCGYANQREPGFPAFRDHQLAFALQILALTFFVSWLAMPMTQRDAVEQVSPDER